MTRRAAGRCHAFPFGPVHVPQRALPPAPPPRPFVGAGTRRPPSSRPPGVGGGATRCWRTWRSCASSSPRPTTAPWREGGGACGAERGARQHRWRGARGAMQFCCRGMAAARRPWACKLPARCTRVPCGDLRPLAGTGPLAGGSTTSWSMPHPRPCCRLLRPATPHPLLLACWAGQPGLFLASIHTRAQGVRRAGRAAAARSSSRQGAARSLAPSLPHR